MRQKREPELKKATSITLTILDIICSIPEALACSFLDQKSVLNRLNSCGEYKSLPANYLNDLIKRGYVERTVDPVYGNKSIRLTHKGLIKHIENNQNFVKDGKWRFLSFDIPEEFRVKRNQFRRSIKRIGFRQIQKSLWACPFVKADQIDIVIEELDIRKFVGYIVAAKTDLQQDLEKLFKD